MKRAPLEVRVKAEATPEDDTLTVRTETGRLEDDQWRVLGSDMHCLDLREEAVRAGLITLGWTPPKPKHVPHNNDTLTIDRALVEIAGPGAQAPMLSYLGNGLVMTGGTMRLPQIVALAALMAKVTK